MRSLRQRFVVLSVFALLTLVGALAAVVGLAQTSLRARLERGEAMAEAEVLRMLSEHPALGPDDPLMGAPRHRGRGPWGLRFADGRELGGGLLSPELVAVRDAALARAAGAEGVVTVAGEAGPPRGLRGNRRPLERRVVVGAARRADGARVWAAVYVPAGVDERWRGAVALLALSAVILVGLALRGVASLRDGANTLRRSLAALAGDLAAPIERPEMTELAAISDGIAELARALQFERNEQARLREALNARERLAALGRVVAGVSHEVRNPLASIKLKVDLAAMELAEQPPGVAQDLRDVGDEIARLDRLVSDLLVISGRRAVVRAETDLRALCEARCELAGPLAAQRGVRFEVEGAGRFSLDRDAVTRLVDNLLRNAVEASPDGGVVRVEVAVDGQVARLAVHDQGAGVDPSRAHELFEPFFTTRPSGTGLGLALSRAVAVAHGGTLRYERRGATTTFRAEFGA